MTQAFNQDCMEAMRQIPDKAFELAICDVPYGINVGRMAYLQEVKTTVKQKNGTRLNGSANKRPYARKGWDDKTPSQEYFNELRRVSLEQIVFGIDYCDWQDVGPGRIRWDKLMPDGVSFNRYEVAYCSAIDHAITIPLLWAGMLQAKSIMEPTTQQGNKRLNEKRIHPCHKPILLYQSLLHKFAKPGDRILDTHLGSGSSRIAAHQMGFDFVGYELDRDYFDAQEKRFKEAIMQQSLFL